MIQLNEKTHLYVSTYQRLYEYIELNALKDGDKLPGENQLSEILGISRMTLRHAINLMVDDGRIRRVHGSGNFVVRQERYNRMGLERAGNPVKFYSRENIGRVDFDSKLEISNDFERNIFSYSVKTAILTANRWYIAGDSAIAYCFSLVDLAFLRHKEIDLELDGPLVDLLEQGIYEECQKTQTDISIASTTSFVSETHSFGSRPMLLLSESVYYSHSSLPVVYNKFYLEADRFRLYLNGKNPKGVRR